MSIYVPNIDRWVNHYTAKSGGHVKLVADPKVMSVGTNVGLATESYMSVSKVEPTRPLPPVPMTGTTSALRTVAPSEGTLQRAMFDAKRSKLEEQKAMANAAAPDYRKSSKKGKKNNKNKQNFRKSPTLKKKHLFGTPGDIFKTKSDSKLKVNKKKKAKQKKK